MNPPRGRFVLINRFCNLPVLLIEVCCRVHKRQFLLGYFQIDLKLRQMQVAIIWLSTGTTMRQTFVSENFKPYRGNSLEFPIMRLIPAVILGIVVSVIRILFPPRFEMEWC